MDTNGYVLPDTLTTDANAETFASAAVRVFFGPASNGAAIQLAGVNVALSAAAAAAATSLTVTALAKAVPAGSFIDFGSFVARTTADAASGATTLTVAALPFALASTATGKASQFVQASNMEEFSYAPKDTTEEISLLGATYMVASKAMLGGSGTIKLLGGKKDPAVALLLAASKVISTGAVRSMVVLYPDGEIIGTEVTVGAPAREVASGKAYRKSFTLPQTGAVYSADGEATTPTFTKDA